MAWLDSLKTGLVEWWELNENGGARTGIHAGTVLSQGGTVNRSALAPANLLYSADFSGNNSANYLATAHARMMFTGSVSINAWVRQDALDATRAYASNRDSASDLGYGIGHNATGNRLAVGVGNQFITNASCVFTDINTWMMITGVLLNGVNFYIYKNGNATPCHQVSTTQTLDAATSGFYVGRAPIGQPTDGYIAQVAVWNKVLTTTEIAALYGSGSGLQYIGDHIPSNQSII